ncbi:MAG: hypothetical protein U0136_03105 [Bdellovibrionota bacterium]
MNELLTNPHPPLSGFPVVILTLLVLSIGWNRYLHRDESAIQDFLSVMLGLFAVLTYYSGYWGFDRANQSFSVDEAAILRHQGYARFFVLLVVPLLLIGAVRKAAPPEREQLRRALRLFWEISVLGLWILGAYASALGGRLVFDHGAAVRAALPTAAAETKPQ